jgi:4-hydroxy-3-methylbut-2-enyl diphosphate reductase
VVKIFFSGGVVKVRLADSAGFCYGVRKAMDCVLDVSRGKERVYTLGPLIHNPQALDMLESRHVYVTNTIDESLRGKTVVIRAHGVPPEVKKKLEKAGAHVVDATCPNVLRSEGIIKKYHAQGYALVIVGDRGHAEIEALLGYAGHTGTVIETLEEASRLPSMDKVCVVAQTTLNSDRYNEIAEEVSRHATVCYIARTVCSSTERRQEDIRKLAQTTDATVVVGGRNSANTKRLAEISRELGQPTFLIENPSELDLEALSRYSEIGVTAGASTPNWVIQQVVDVISSYTPLKHSAQFESLRSPAFFAVEGNIVLVAGAAALTYAMCLFMNIPPLPRFYLMTFFYLFPLHAINKYLEMSGKHRAMNPVLRRYWNIYLAFSAISFPIALGIAFYSDALTFSLVLVSYLLGGLYSIRVIPAGWKTRFRSLRDIPGSKDVMIATAWTFAVVVLPAITHEVFPGLVTLVGAAFVFTIVFSRALILAMGGVESDRLVGMETIPVLIGRKKTIWVLYFMNSLLALSLAVLAVIFRTEKPLVLLIPLVYMLLAIHPLSKKGFIFRTYHQLALDVDFFLTAVLAYFFLR